jgi:hypothetical protein
VDLAVLTNGAPAGAQSGVPHADLLAAFAEATVAEDDEALARARERLRAALGPEAVVDAAGVTSNFERMVRVADATGIPLDAPVAALTADVRRELGIDRFAASALTPEPGPLARWLARRLAPLVPRMMRASVRVWRRVARR